LLFIYRKCGTNPTRTYTRSVTQILHDPMYTVRHKSCTNPYTKCGTNPARTYIQSVAQILHEPVYKVWHNSYTNLYTQYGTNPARTYIQSVAQILHETIYKVWQNSKRTYIPRVAQILHGSIYKVWHKSYTNVCTKCCKNPARTYIDISCFHSLSTGCIAHFYVADIQLDVCFISVSYRIFLRFFKSDFS
jgi:hypothetical protein